jgi:hypothetical protein
MPTAWAMATHAETAHAPPSFVAILPVAARRLGRPCAPGWDDDDQRRPLPDRRRLPVFGLALGNHSLTTLLIVPGRRSTSSLSIPHLAPAPAGPLVCRVLALRSSSSTSSCPSRRAVACPLVYGTPETWEGFKYIVLAEQFRDSVIDPFGDLPRKFGDLVTRTSTQFGILAPLIPIAFIATAVRRPRYALLTGTAVAITCFFASSYVNADISRTTSGRR